MSEYVPPNYSKRQLNLQMVNCYTAIHDLNCNCEKPLVHIIKQIEEQEPTVKKWRDSTTTDAGSHTGGDVVDDFGPDELEKLFEQDAEDTKG